MHKVLVNRLGGLSLPRKSVVRLTDRPDMTLDVYRGRKTTMQQQQIYHVPVILVISCSVEQSVHADCMGLVASNKLTLLIALRMAKTLEFWPF